MNPFSYGTIATGKNFYDRKEETARIIETLTGGNNMVLHAPRRFGKTSLVFKVIEKLEAEAYICIYFDFMPVYSPESFVRLYTKALAAKQTNLNKFAQTFATIIKNIRPVLNFGEDGSPEFSVDFASSKVNETMISELLDLTEKLASSDKRVIVFFDEFQEIDKLKTINFENLLRSKIQQQQRTNYLFFGSKTHMLKEMFNDKKKAFYNAASQMSIGPLPEKDTIDFIQSNFTSSGIQCDDANARYIITNAENIPHYIQLISAEVWQYMINAQTTVTKEIVDVCVKTVLALKTDYYIELFDRQSHSRKQLLKALTINGENIFSAEYIQTHRLPVASTIQRAEKELIKEGIIERLKNKYFIADPFFKLYISECYTK